MTFSEKLYEKCKNGGLSEKQSGLIISAYEKISEYGIGLFVFIFMVYLIGKMYSSFGFEKSLVFVIGFVFIALILDRRSRS